MNSYDIENYEDFLQAVTELYDQNKLDFNNYKLLKNELDELKSLHEQYLKKYASYIKILEYKINKISISGGGGGGISENQVQNIVSNYVNAHKNELKGDKGDRGTDGLTTKISVNGTTYTQSNGLITLPNYPTLSGSGSGLTTTQERQITVAYNHSQTVHAPSNAEQNVQSNWTETNTTSDAYIKNKPILSTVATSGSYNDLTNKPSTISISFNGNTYTPDSNGLITLPNSSSSGGGSTGSIDTSNFVIFNDSYVSDCNLHYVNGYAKTNNRTAHVPAVCVGSPSVWGILFCILENSINGTGSQMYFPIDGPYKGRIFVRSVKNLKISGSETSNWTLLDIVTNSNVSIDEPSEM